MRGRKPKPRPSGEPQAITLIKPPPELRDEARREWKRVAPGLLALGVLTDLDRSALISYCQAYGRWRAAEKALAEMATRDPVTGGLLIKTAAGNAIQNPIVGIANRAMADMVRFAAEFGMTPSARARPRTAEAAALGKKEEAIAAAMHPDTTTKVGDLMARRARMH